jgi:hypothetical protein
MILRNHEQLSLTRLAQQDRTMTNTTIHAFAGLPQQTTSLRDLLNSALLDWFITT